MFGVGVFWRSLQHLQNPGRSDFALKTRNGTKSLPPFNSVIYAKSLGTPALHIAAGFAGKGQVLPGFGGEKFAADDPARPFLRQAPFSTNAEKPRKKPVYWRYIGDILNKARR